MKKRISALLLSLLLCGCQNIDLPASPVGNGTNEASLTLAIPVGSGSICYEVAQELARRATDFAENSLSVTIVMEENIWDSVERGEVDLVVCENNRLVRDALEREKVQYPQVAEAVSSGKVTGDAAMFAMMEYPYFFRDSHCVIEGGNNPDVLAALNYSLPQTMTMELKRLSYCGEYHWYCEDGAAVRDYFSEHHFDDILQGQLALGRDIREPLSFIDGSGLSLKEVDACREFSDVEGKTLFLSGGRQMILDIFVNPQSMEKLTEAQRAAVEEAVVYSGGYSRTLADSRQEEALEELKRQGMLIREGDVGLWHEAFQEQYRSETSPLKVELVNLLDEKTKRFH